MYWPRSRGDTRSPMVAMAPVSKPPAPRPCSARNAMSWSIECARPDRAEPARNITIAIISQRLRPNWSPSLPYSGVVTVEASTYEVTTQDRCVTPPRSPTILGSAVETTSWSSMASMIASSSPGRMMSTSRRTPELSAPPRGAAAAFASAMPRSLLWPSGPVTDLLWPSGPITDLFWPSGPVTDLFWPSGPVTDLSRPAEVAAGPPHRPRSGRLARHLLADRLVWPYAHTIDGELTGRQVSFGWLGAEPRPGQNVGPREEGGRRGTGD